MKTDFSLSWKSSKKPSKQRKYLFNMPMHLRGRLLNVHLSKELRAKYNKRAIRVKKGDKVRILRGQYKGRTGSVESVSLADSKVMISGIQIARKDGTKGHYPFNPTNLVIEELNLTDKKRIKNGGTNEKSS